MLARRREELAAVFTCPGEQGASDRLRADAHVATVTHGDTGGSTSPWAVVASQPAGRRLRPGLAGYTASCARTRSRSWGRNWVGSGSNSRIGGSKCRIRGN